jgi:uncharacterized lipoprotein YddW (UPF0748 family)
LYPSERLPWTHLPAGAGRDPGFDPLAVAVQATHRAGMELHAWINVFRIGDSATGALHSGVRRPHHIAHAEPGWVRRVDGDLWLDPAVGEARQWMLDNVLEIVRGYDIDGVHFDFARYPQGGFRQDAARFEAAPAGHRSLADWRRHHISAFMASAFRAVTAVKPWVKVGAAPLGNYMSAPGWPGLWAFDDVFQESRAWADSGWVDYLAPQLYYSTGTVPEVGKSVPSPDFALLIDEWRRTTPNRPVIAGMGAYKAAEGRFPEADLSYQVAASRASGAGGHAIYRYEHLVRYARWFRDIHPRPALPASMRHRPQATPPGVPGRFRLESIRNRVALLAWEPSTATREDPLRGYALFRRIGAAPHTSTAQDLLTLLPAGTHRFADTLRSNAPVFYQLVAVSRLGMASAPTGAVPTFIPEAIPALPIDAVDVHVKSITPNPVRDVAVVEYAVGRAGPVRLRVTNLFGRPRVHLDEAALSAGRHRLTIDTSGLPPGIYVFVIAADGISASEPFVVVR